MRLVALGVYLFFALGSGTRTILHRRHVRAKYKEPSLLQLQNAPADKNQILIENGWSKGAAAFICMKKWQKWKFFTGRSTEDYCLVNLEHMKDAIKDGAKSKDYKMTVSTLWGECIDESAPHAMKLCTLKGKRDKRVSYSNRVHVPKACLSLSKQNYKPDDQTHVNLLRAAVTALECDSLMRETYAAQGKFAKEQTTAQVPTLSNSSGRAKQSEETTAQVPTLSKSSGRAKRIDPEDGVARTLEEMKRKYEKQYSNAEIEAYFKTCKLVETTRKRTTTGRRPRRHQRPRPQKT